MLPTEQSRPRREGPSAAVAESGGGILTVRNKGGVGPRRSLGQHPGISAEAEGRTPRGGWESWEPRGTKLESMALERAGAQPGLKGRSEGGGGEMAAGPAHRGRTALRHGWGGPSCSCPCAALCPAAARSRPRGDAEV